MAGERDKRVTSSPAPMKEFNSGRSLLLAILLSLATGLTMVNAPYLVLGYGLGSLSVFTVGFLLKPVLAVTTFLLGHSVGIILVRFTDGIFTLVAIAALIVRPIGVYLVSKLKEKMGLVSAALVALVFSTLVATFLGTLFFGEGGISAALAVFDATYILPSYIIAKSVADYERRPNARPMLPAIVLIAVLGLFTSAVPFLVPAGSAISATVLLLSYIIVRYPSKLNSKGVLTILLVLAIVATPASLLTNPNHFSHNLRSTMYPLYPDSLARNQWIQKETAPECRQGDLAGGRKEETGVWGPERLRVIDTCVVATGVILGIVPQLGPANDRDFNLDLDVDSEYKGLLSLGSIILRSGTLHVEVVPSDQLALRDLLTTLKPGDRVTVVGALVIDTDHGHWSEVHPAWVIRRS